MKKGKISILICTALILTSLAGCKKTVPVEENKNKTNIVYCNATFDYASNIAEEKKNLKLEPAVTLNALTISDANNMSGLVLVPDIDTANSTDYYLNAYLKGAELTFTGDIKSAQSSIGGEIAISEGKAIYTPKTLMADNPVDEIITFTMNDGTQYKVHTLNQKLPTMLITNNSVSEAGVYSMTIDKVLLRVNTDGEIVYYRNMDCVGQNAVANLCKHYAKDGNYYTFSVELAPELRGVGGGSTCGMYVVMDENYSMIDSATLLPNDKNSKHGEGYLDEHDFLVLGKGHYITLSYMPVTVYNLPDSVTGVDGGKGAHIWTGIFQEIKDGKLLKEINTADYPLLYELSVEKRNYANSSPEILNADDPKKLFEISGGWQDYAHPNSIDYTLDENGNVDKLLVSMRNQAAVYQFDFETGEIDWILGGKASTFTGYDAVSRARQDDDGNAFNALTFAQHHARYTNKDENGRITGNTEISIYDNHTGSAPFKRESAIPTETRAFKVSLDETNKTATISDMVVGTDLDKLTDKYHSASHCGSVQYQGNNVVIGWGYHPLVDGIPPQAPAGTYFDAGYPDLKQGWKPVVSEYDKSSDKITFELTCLRNKNIKTKDGLYSYRTYKDVD